MKRAVICWRYRGNHIPKYFIVENSLDVPMVIESMKVSDMRSGLTTDIIGVKETDRECATFLLGVALENERHSDIYQALGRIVYETAQDDERKF